jgi:hypothetical protein
MLAAQIFHLCRRCSGNAAPPFAALTRRRIFRIVFVNDVIVHSRRVPIPRQISRIFRDRNYSPEFTKIVQSLHPIRDEKAAATAASAQNSTLRFHPKVFSMINCWISDSESPVVTEINLDAVEKNGNEFNHDGLKQDGEWLKCPVPDTNGFMRYRVLESKDNHYKIEYQENGGGTLTTASIIEFDIGKRNIRREDKPSTIRVLRVSSYNAK